MAAILGIDVGTSSAKVMLLEAETGVTAVESEAYEVEIPQIGWAEQDPEVWFAAVERCLIRLRERHGRAYAQVAGIGLSGQMHGLVLVDREGRPVRPAILWLDQRSTEECRWLEREIPGEVFQETLKNRIFTGFALPSLLWVKRHEPERFSAAYRVLQPKDYIRYRLTGRFGAEATDASATLMFDVAGRDWAWEVIERCGFVRSLFPACRESGEIAGNVSGPCARRTGLPASARVIFGMGDQQAQSLGNGVFREGDFICNIGTGGQVSAFCGSPVCNSALRTQTFCHCVGGGYSVYGAILNAGLALKWLRDNILGEPDFARMSELAQEAPAGSEGVIFLPYLAGERTPHMDPDACGMFYGLRLAHTKAHMARAVMEGVTFALRDCMEILKQMGIAGKRVISSGGGASSPVWLQIQADIFDREICVCDVAEQACLGACMLAGVSLGIYGSLEEAAKKLVSYGRVYRPEADNVKRYNGMYERYGELYRRTVFPKLR